MKEKLNSDSLEPELKINLEDENTREKGSEENKK